MNLEELSKSQLILLTILVNFVTSIATGILTVSFLDQVPSVVTKTVNQIVDHTIETVTQAAPATVIASTPSTQDQITAAFAADAARTVQIYAAATGTSTPAVAVGTYLPRSRAVATAALDALPQEVLITFANGLTAPASLSHLGQGIAIYGFADKATLPAAATPGLVASKTLKIGETVLALTLDGSGETGIVSRVTADSGIHTTLPAIGTGAAAVDIAGDIVGIASGASAGSLISADVIYSLLTSTSTAATSTSSGA